MRQSTLLFGGGGGAEHAEGATKEGERSQPPPPKRARRSAASKSEERSKRQMQMTLALDGALNCSVPEVGGLPKRETILIEDEDEEHGGEAKEQQATRREKPQSLLVPAMSLAVKGTAGKGNTDGVHSFFARKQATQSQDKASQWAPAQRPKPVSSVKQRWPLQRDAPWPDAGSIHVQPEEPPSDWNRSLPRHEPQRQREMPSIDQQDLAYPWKSASKGSAYASTSYAGSRIQRTEDDGCLWVDQWRPRRATEVLGNEGRAEYLRDWLQELQLRGVIANTKDARQVERRKRKAKRRLGALESFIVDDDEEEQAWFDQFRKQDETLDADTELEAEGAPDSLRTTTLTNAIVLCGPTGIGKTAAVYACAAELGFEVFELYPGVGRRSGKDVSQAVGDLGRNHMVSSGGMGGGATWKGTRPVQETEVGGSVRPRQSLILLEEVDVLYEDDKGFWSAVVDLISESRRPIVMTCNDLSCIPLDELPIQDVLHFEPPLESQAVPYLQAMASKHGVQLSTSHAHQLYASTSGNAETQWQTSRLAIPASGPLHPSTMLASVDKHKSRGEAPARDLRQAVMQLQFDSVLAETGELSGGQADTAIQGMRAAIESAERHSFVDAVFCAPFERSSEVLEPDEHASCIDDVQGQGTILLFKARLRMETIALPTQRTEEQYREALVPHCAPSDKFARFDDERQRASHRLDALLKALFVSPSSRVPSWESVVDYGPMIGNMIQADDEDEAAHQARLTHLLEAQTGSLDAASSSLLKMGIRPSRTTTRLLLQRGSDGLIALGKRESDFSRWVLIDSLLIQQARNSRLV